MQTYLFLWQFPDQEAHMKGADVFAQYVESGCESDKFEGFEVINRVVNPEGASGWMGDCQSIRSQNRLEMVSALV